jgi:regulator of sirC expression with transglutaminase-like and TPR domain
MNLDAALELLSRNPGAPLDVAELALTLAADEYPHLDVEGWLGEIDAMAQEARRLMRGSASARVHGLCRYLFHEMGFHGNKDNYYDSRNSYLNQVLERRTGIPISLSAITIAVGRRAGLSIEGVGLPGHFIVKATDGPEEILFDPFHGGRVLQRSDCANLVRQVTGEDFAVTDEALAPIALAAMVRRMLNNLKAIYLRAEDYPRSVRVIQRLRQLDPHDPLQHRDLGVCLLHANQPGRALGHLEAYLDAMPTADDADTVRGFIKQVRALLASMN